LFWGSKEDWSGGLRPTAPHGSGLPPPDNAGWLFVDLDQFQGLDQIGEEGLKDKVNNHYLQIFGTSIALGVIVEQARSHRVAAP